MKVLICIPCLLTGGTEIQTLNLVKSLIQGKHQEVPYAILNIYPKWYPVIKKQEAG